MKTLVIEMPAWAEPCLAHRLVTRGWAAGVPADGGKYVRDILPTLRVPD